MRNRLFPLTVLGESWEHHRILQAAQEHGRFVLFSFLFIYIFSICIHSRSCKAFICMCFTLSFFPLAYVSHFIKPYFLFKLFGVFFSLLPTLLPSLNRLLCFLVPIILLLLLLHCCSVVTKPATKMAKKRTEGMSQLWIRQWSMRRWLKQ